VDTPSDAEDTAVTQGISRPDGTASHETAVIDPAVLAGISDQLEQLRLLVETRAAEAAQQQQWLTQLTSELADYRNDFVFKNVISRIFRDLIHLHDTLGETLDPATLDGATKEDLGARLVSLQKQLVRTLDRQGLEQVTSDTRAPFDGAEQEAIDTRLVDRPEDDGVVVESARCGFRYGMRLLRPESVIVGRYAPENED
jgi:molecular chaperone GrpE